MSEKTNDELIERAICNIPNCLNKVSCREWCEKHFAIFTQQQIEKAVAAERERILAGIECVRSRESGKRIGYSNALEDVRAIVEGKNE